ncbi:MAG: DUF6709 family protein [Acetatifactor sp.]
MLEELKKKTFKKSLVGTIMLIIIGAVLTVISIMKVSYVTFEDLEPDEIKNQSVTIDVTADFGCYLEEYSENTSTHRRTTTDLYYVIWTGDENVEEFKYMSIKVPVKYEKQMEEIAEYTANQTYADPLHLVGHIRELSKEEYRYFKEYFVGDDITESDFKEMTLPYYIDVTGTSAFAGSDLLFIILLVAGIFCLFWAVIRLLKGINGSFIKKFLKNIEDAGYTESSIESDLNHAVSFNKNDIRLGNLCLYFGMNSSAPNAIPVNKIHWAYQTTTTHRTNGIKTGTTYAIMIRADVKGGTFNISVPDNGTSQAILDHINVKYPWVVVGYSDELVKMYNKDRAQFLNLRYNKVEHNTVQPGLEGFNDSYNNFT